MKRPIFSLVVFAFACGGAAPTPRDVHIDTADAGPVTTIATPHAKLGIPHDPVALATIDATSFLNVSSELRASLEHELDLPTGALGGRLDALGLDVRRPVTFVIAPLDDAERKLVDDLLPHARDRAPATDMNAIAERVLAHHAAAIRVLVPATDAKKLQTTLTAFFEREGWHASPKGLLRHGEVIEMSDDGATVAVDIGLSRAARESAAAIHAAFDGVREPPASLDGAIFRATYSPDALARFGFLQSVTQVSEVIAGSSIDASQRERIFTQGMWEASRLISLPAFERIDTVVNASPFEIVIRAHPTRFTVPAATPSVTLDGATVSFDATQWPLATPDVMTTVKDSGAFGVFVALPQLLASAGTVLPGIAHLIAPDAFVITRFERAGMSWTQGQDEIFVGLMPASSTHAAAECALAVKTPCDAKSKLVENKVVTVNGQEAKLVSIDKRFIVLLSHDKAALAAAKPKLAPAGPIRFDAKTIAFTAALKTDLTLPDHVTGSVAVDRDALVFRVGQ